MNKIKVVFMGTPNFSVNVLKMLIEKCEVLMVVTQPDTYVGRKKVLTYSPVKEVALENNIPVFQPERIRKDYECLKALDFDLLITCAYGQILPKEILDMPKFGAVNVHASLLPKYRGSAPINYAILNGEKETGITLMYMNEKMDEGNIIKQAKMLINDMNYGQLYDALSVLGTNLLAENLEYLVSGHVESIMQNNEEATYCQMLTRDFEHLDFNNKGIDIVNKVRALNPEPLSNILINDTEVKILKASFVSGKATVSKVYIDKKSFGIGCEDGIVYLEEVKPAGKNVMDIKGFLNGLKNKEEIVIK